MTYRTVIIYSGGLDSTVLLYHLRNRHYTVRCLSFNYGQRHKKELSSAKAICELTATPCEVVDISLVSRLIKGNALTDLSVPIPEGSYSEAQMKATVVPNRNMMMLSIALSYAISIDFDAVAYGAHRGDHAVYPDCREEFAGAMNLASGLCDYKERSVIFPLITYTKAEIVKLGSDLKVPFGMTWSCYRGGDVHCGRCGTCNERKKAFIAAGIPDPTEYE